MTSFTGVIIFERTDFPEGPGNRFDTDPMVIIGAKGAFYNNVRHETMVKARSMLINGAMAVAERGDSTVSMLSAAERIMDVNNATYSFKLPDGKEGEFLIRISIVAED